MQSAMHAGSGDDGDASGGEDSDNEASGRFSEAEALEFVLKHKESVEEVKALCGDLQVPP